MEWDDSGEFAGFGSFPPESVVSQVLDTALIGAEIGMRQVYWRLPSSKSKKIKTISKPRGDLFFDKEKIREHLRAIGVKEGALLMVHTSIDGMGERDGMGKARWLIETLLELIGKTGTLTMPAHPLYRQDPGFMNDKSGLVFDYFPETQPSRVGIINEVFRRTMGVKRSLHPLSSLCSYGPLSNDLLEHNLNDDRPLPHGVHSSYYKFCRANGLVVSIGLPLAGTMTICHVAEELRDKEWSVNGFFYERMFWLPKHSGRKVWIVRERRPEFVRSLAKMKRNRDLRRNGIIHEASVGGIRIDHAHSAQVVSFMLQRNQKSTYPFYFAGLSRI